MFSLTSSILKPLSLWERALWKLRLKGRVNTNEVSSISRMVRWISRPTSENSSTKKEGTVTFSYSWYSLVSLKRVRINVALIFKIDRAFSLK